MLVRTLTACALAAALGGCGDDEQPTRLVIGVTSDYQAGSDLQRLDVEKTVDGAVVADDALRLGISAGSTQFPTEIGFPDLAGGARVGVTMRGFDADDVLRVVRHVETTAVASQSRLVRAHLEQLCRLTTPEEVMDGAPPSAPTCDETSETCISGRCRPAFVEPSAQKTYSEDWADATGDVCKPQSGAEPTVIVGLGQGDYFAADDHEVAEVEAGPQGGHHIWVAARIKNLRRAGSITSVGGEIPDLGLTITPLKVVFTLDPDEGGFCKLFGLRFQLDIDGDEIETMLGKEVKVTVTVTDSDGAVGSDDLWVTLSDYISEAKRAASKLSSGHAHASVRRFA